MANKFIVTSEGWLRLGNVAMHRDLLQPGESCIGGGMYEFDYVNMRLLLSGRSYDFGRVKWSWIDRLIVDASLSDISNYYEDLPITDFVPIAYAQ
ncbi:MAG: hypothetical protein K2L93_00980 [Muribaculaceae bacterium]|nr:hypothetical protein [Muribaculaceae bacterium]